jgi:NADH:ubiquinone oxidoreductase subunit H
MTALVLTGVWLGIVSTALVACAVLERSARLVPRPDRPELLPLRAFWGGALEAPPARTLTARGLAGFARIIRSQSVVSDHRPGLQLLGRLGACVSLAVGLAIVPFVGTWGGGPADAPLLLLDLQNGLAAIGFLLLMTSFCRVAVGLSERNAWSRLGSARQASRSLAAIGLLTLVLAPLAIGSGSLRLHEIVLGQQLSIAQLAWLLETLGGEFFENLRAWPLPAWNLFTQPLTAILFIPAMGLLLGAPQIADPTTGATLAAGLGIDADPIDAYWSKLEARLSLVLASALFVTLFLGAGSIPFFDPARLVLRLSPFVGETLPMLLVAGLHIGSFLAKCLLVLATTARMKRMAALARPDRSIRFATRRLIPLAWANLLLVAASTLWFAEFFGSAG